MIWTPLLSAHSTSNYRPSTMQSGKISHSALGHAPLRVPASVHMMHGLHGHHTSIPKQYSGYHCLLGVCKACSGSGWAATIFHGILAVGKVSLGCIEYALCVRVNTWVMSNMLYSECPGLQAIRDRHVGLFGEHAATMIQFMWQDDIRGVAMFIKECLGVYYGTVPDGGQASDQP